jgi:hypothetical protein
MDLSKLAPPVLSPWSVLLPLLPRTLIVIFGSVLLMLLCLYYAFLVIRASPWRWSSTKTKLRTSGRRHRRLRSHPTRKQNRRQGSSYPTY